MEALIKKLDDHINTDEKFQKNMKDIMFGNLDEGTMGMVRENREMYQIIISLKVFLNIAKWLAPVVLMFAIFKGWFLALLQFIYPR